MHKLYQDGFAAAEVLMHLSKAYRLDRLEKEAEATRKKQATAEEARRRAAEEARRRSEEWNARWRSKLENLRSRHPIRYWAFRCGFDLDDTGARIALALIAGFILFFVVLVIAAVIGAQLN
jgi:uncharacterized damage-inducible protein DinB